MRSKSQTTSKPVSTHATMHLLIGPESMPTVHADESTPGGGAAEPVAYPHVAAEHRTLDFDHTATFSVSGPRAAIERLVDDCQAALRQLQPPDAQPQRGRPCPS